MNPSDPLAQLHPLREPALIGWWPPAPGWWLLSALCLTACAAAAWWLYRRYRRNAYRRQGLRRLDSILEQYAADRDVENSLRRINALLKAVALKAYPRREIAAISGENWRSFLSATTTEGPPLEITVLTAHYRPGADAGDVEALAAAARHWISRHEVQR